MQKYVWGILTSLFIVDMLKLNYEKSHKQEQISTVLENLTQPLDGSRMKVKSEDGSEIKIEYEGTDQNRSFTQTDSLQVKILYW